jgi:hypothetical protein
LRGRDYQQTFFAVADYHDLAVLASFEERFQTVQPQVTLRSPFAVTAEAGGLE